MAQLTPAQAFEKAGALERSGKFVDAERLYRMLAVREPKSAAAYRGLGVCLRRMGRVDDAVMALVRATELQPDYAEAFNSLGNCLQDKNQVGAAVRCWERAIRALPNYPEPHFNMGAALRRSGNLPASEVMLRKAVELRPNYVDALNTLGNVLRDKGELDDAIACYESAVHLSREYAIAHNNLGNALKDTGKLQRAEDHLRRAIALSGHVPEFHLNLGSVLQDQGRLDEAQESWKQAIALRPEFAEAGSNLLLSLHYRDGNDAEFVFREHVGWAKRYAQPLTDKATPIELPTGLSSRKIRVGYVSPDFRRHSVAYFIESVLQSHDRERFEIVCYSDVVRPDDVTKRFESYATTWRSIVALDDARVADLVRADKIDLLVDLAGHTARNRQGVFARKPAPVQATYLGYCNTTGQSATDYAITDGVLDPESAAGEWHTEALVRMPRCFVCYRPADDAPDVAPLPALANGFVTFGTFNHFPKITPEMLDAWAKILLAVPGSGLLIKSAGLEDEVVRHRTMTALVGRGVEADRVTLLGRDPSYTGHLATYGRVDIGLDTFPYHGTTTTCEAMWMGVPTVTLAGTTRVSRVGVSLNRSMGLEDFIAGTVEEYVAIAVARAGELDRLSELRGSMRERMHGTGLVDSVRFTRELEALFFEMMSKRK